MITETDTILSIETKKKAVELFEKIVNVNVTNQLFMVGGASFQIHKAEDREKIISMIKKKINFDNHVSNRTKNKIIAIRNCHVFIFDECFYATQNRFENTIEFITSIKALDYQKQEIIANLDEIWEDGIPFQINILLIGDPNQLSLASERNGVGWGNEETGNSIVEARCRALNHIKTLLKSMKQGKMNVYKLEESFRFIRDPNQDFISLMKETFFGIQWRDGYIESEYFKAYRSKLKQLCVKMFELGMIVNDEDPENLKKKFIHHCQNDIEEGIEPIPLAHTHDLCHELNWLGNDGKQKINIPEPKFMWNPEKDPLHPNQPKFGCDIPLNEFLDTLPEDQMKDKKTTIKAELESSPSIKGKYVGLPYPSYISTAKPNDKKYTPCLYQLDQCRTSCPIQNDYFTIVQITSGDLESPEFIGLSPDFRIDTGEFGKVIDVTNINN